MARGGGAVFVGNCFSSLSSFLFFFLCFFLTLFLERVQAKGVGVGKRGKDGGRERLRGLIFFLAFVGLFFHQKKNFDPFGEGIIAFITLFFLFAFLVVSMPFGGGGGRLAVAIAALAVAIFFLTLLLLLLLLFFLASEERVTGIGVGK